MRIGIVGFGYVGKYVYEFFKPKIEHNIFIYEENSEVLSKWNIISIISKEDIASCDIVFICVPTPAKEDGSCDTSIVEDIIINYCGLNSLIVIKSTVEVGFTQKMKDQGHNKHIVFSPEYAGESTYDTPYDFHKEMKKSPFFIFGGDKEDCSRLIDLYIEIAGPTKKYIMTDSTSAEMAKYMENSFFATKIIFCNECREICNVFGIDYNEVRELWLMDPRINPMHTMVTKSKGFDGKCLPKDLSAIIQSVKKKGLEPELLSKVEEINKLYRMRDKK